MSPTWRVSGGDEFASGEGVSNASRISVDFVDENLRQQSSFETIEEIRSKTQKFDRRRNRIVPRTRRTARRPAHQR